VCGEPCQAASRCRHDRHGARGGAHLRHVLDVVQNRRVGHWQRLIGPKWKPESVASPTLSVGEVRHRPFLLAHMQGIGCRPAAGQHNSTLAPATHMRLSGCLVFCPQCPLSTLLCPQLPLPGQQLKILPDPASEAAKQQRFWYAMYLGEAPAQTFDGLAEKEDASRIKVPATTKQCHLPTQRRS